MEDSTYFYENFLANVASEASNSEIANTEYGQVDETAVEVFTNSPTTPPPPPPLNIALQNQGKKNGAGGKTAAAKKGAKIAPAPYPISKSNLVNIAPAPPQAPKVKLTPGQLHDDGQFKIAITNNSQTTVKPYRHPIGSEEWLRARRENHKEVERRRRESINDGINELARLVPGCEKNKGSILNRTVQYIHEVREQHNQQLEKFTLEKLLLDKAINELSNMVDELQKMNNDLCQENAKLKDQVSEYERKSHYQNNS